MRFSTLYHLVKGKKTTSVLSFGKFYDILGVFYLFPKLNQDKFNEIIEQCIEDGFLSRISENHVQLNEAGKEILIENRQFNFKNECYLNYKYSDLFWNRLVFLSQVVSYKYHEISYYEPVERDPFKQMRLKLWLSENMSADFSDKMYTEWLYLCNSMTREQEMLTIGQLVGFDESGETLSQLSASLGLSKVGGYLVFKETLYQIIVLCESSPEKLPIFSSLLSFIKEEIRTESSFWTKSLYLEGTSVEEISRIRHIKSSTVVDHLIAENLFSDSELLFAQIPRETMDVLKKYTDTVDLDVLNWKYSDISLLHPSISFLFYRLYQFYFIEERGVW